MSRTFETIQSINSWYYPTHPSEYFYKPSKHIHEHRKHIDGQLKLFRRYLSQTNHQNNNKIINIFGDFKTRRNLLFERKYNELSLFETFLSTPGTKEVIELVWDMSDMLKDENVLQMVNFKFLVFNFSLLFFLAKSTRTTFYRLCYRIE